jgi:aspartate aminotransferase
MLKLSTAVRRLKPSPTLAIAAKAAQLKAEGVDVIDLSVGEPDLATPGFIQEGAIEAMRRGQTKYTPVDGTPALKAAIQKKFREENGLTFSLKELTVGNGAKQVLFNALLATLDQGDEVLIPAPYWVSYPDMVSFTGATPVMLPCPASQGFKLLPEQLERVIAPRTKWLILNSPSNPTGAVYSRQELQALAAVLERHPHVWVLSDDIYEHLVYEGSAFDTLVSVAPFLRGRTLTVNGLSKAYAMTGWRVGYGAGPEPLIKAMGTLQSQSTSNPCSISQAAACVALEYPDRVAFLASLKAHFQERRDLFVEELKQIPQLSFQIPAGAFYVYVGCESLLTAFASDQEIAAYLLEIARVAVVPGEAFGFSPYLRLSYATSPENLRLAAGRIRAALAALDPKR